METISPIYEYRHYLKQTYGEVLHRVPLDIGCSCPNRTIDKSGGCAFCPEDGARATQLGDAITIEQQIKKGVEFAQKRYNATAFMAYLQAFTSTFSNTRQLDELVSSIVNIRPFRAIAFGARPDCLTDPIISYLQRLHRSIDVWVELGVQSCHDATLKAVNRGHGWKESDTALQRLHKAGILTAVHLIIGLPGEELKHFKQSLQILSTFPIQAIKLHNLHVIKGTRLARQFRAHPFKVYSEYEYAEILLELLPLIPKSCAVIRLTTDTPDNMLVAPHWSMNKAQFRQFLLKQMEKRSIYQGMSYMSSPEKEGKNTAPKPIATEDGSITFWSEEFKEHFHTIAGAFSEARKKYIVPAKLKSRLVKGKVRILDICFGLGYNSLTSCDLALRNNGHLEITALECDRSVVRAASESLQKNASAFNWNECLRDLVAADKWQQQNCSIQIIWGDARHTINSVSGTFDLVWLDAFSTQRNSELWTIDFFKKIARILKKDGALLTYCAAIPVRSAMLEAGFFVGETKPFARERGGTIAGLQEQGIERKLPERDYFLMKTPRGIPYRDPDGTRTNKEILRAREREIVERKAREEV